NDVFLVALSGALDGWSRPSAGRRPVRAGEAGGGRPPVRLRAEAQAYDADAEEPDTGLRRATATISTDDGRRLAVASAVCAVFSPAAMPSDAVGLDYTVGAVGEPPRDTAGEPVDEMPDGLVNHAPPPHPLLGALAAAAEHDDDRLVLRMPPPAWLANRLGRVHAAASCALVDAAISVALTRRLPTGNTAHLQTLDLSVVRSLPLDEDMTVVASVRHVGRRLAVVDVELGQVDAPPSVLARGTVARTTQRRPLP
ncbi:PaaI family thioesterase, partial [Frankia nepalensis]|uniref:PaaI family thioesterase n=1 Tax=Frankia nepalensis TaxID=1836974 RepID=UPI001EE4528A